MATYIPALRARMGDLEYYVSVVTLGEASKMVEYVEQVDNWTSETMPELKVQRKLNVRRVEKEMVPYLLDNPDHFYSALTVEVRLPLSDGTPEQIGFEQRAAFPGGLEFGMLTLDGTETLYAMDGQHRLKSIELAIRQNPVLAREHIALIMVPYHNIVRSQTLFSDLNRYARSPSRSIALLFTHRERLARVTKAVVDEVPLLRDRVNMESTSLSTNSPHFVTLSTLYSMSRSFLGVGVNEEGENEGALVEELRTFWYVLTDQIREWSLVAEHIEHPAYLRQRFLDMHGVAQQAIAVAVATLRAERGTEWSKATTGLGDVDWRLSNPAWQGIAVHGGRVNNTPTSVRLLSDYLVERLS